MSLSGAADHPFSVLANLAIPDTHKRDRLRAVLDVGQYVSATIQARGHPAQILSAWRAGEFGLVTSGPILDDLRRVLFYPHIRKRHRWSDEEIHLWLYCVLITGSVVLTPIIGITTQQRDVPLIFWTAIVCALGVTAVIVATWRRRERQPTEAL